jgi:glutathionylspermidine synthase
MQRITCSPRPKWEQKVEEVGLTYHTIEFGKPYWNESAYYQFNASQIDVLEAAANDLHMKCIDAAERVIEKGLWKNLGIPTNAIQTILKSWERDDFSLYGRFDFAYDGVNPPKMLEYNADTPTALVEAAVAQWYWLQDCHGSTDQFNSLHERLIAAWKKYAGGMKGDVLHFGGIKGHLEDNQTVVYLQDTAHQAGLATKLVYVEDLGWNSEQKKFVDLDNEEITDYFKLYPWEWLWHEQFGVHLSREPMQMIEPAWKMLLSNKGLLPVLWEMFPDHPNLLPTYFETDPKASQVGADYVSKPVLSREGANVAVVQHGNVIESSSGEYGKEGSIVQALAPIPDFQGNRPICGVWIIDHEAGGLGVRESDTWITSNMSRFVPHLFKA